MKVLFILTVCVALALAASSAPYGRAAAADEKSKLFGRRLLNEVVFGMKKVFLSDTAATCEDYETGKCEGGCLIITPTTNENEKTQYEAVCDTYLKYSNKALCEWFDGSIYAGKKSSIWCPKTKNRESRKDFNEEGDTGYENANCQDLSNNFGMKYTGSPDLDFVKFTVTPAYDYTTGCAINDERMQFSFNLKCKTVPEDGLGLTRPDTLDPKKVRYTGCDRSCEDLSHMYGLYGEEGSTDFQEGCSDDHDRFTWRARECATRSPDSQLLKEEEGSECGPPTAFALCEQHGFNEQQCDDVGCCEWDVEQCWGSNEICVPGEDD